MQDGILLKLSSSLYSHLSKDKVYVLLAVIFSILYLPHVFILVEDLGLISAFEADPGVIMGTMDQLLIPPYDMHDAYLSRAYGWTYFAINAVILAPIKFVSYIFDIENKFLFYMTTRLILFLIGLISVIAFYELAKLLFSNKFISCIAALLYIISPVGAKFFYFLHPETTGSMFIFLAVICLLKFIKTPQNNNLYFWGLTCLVLAALSKQIFFFISVPIVYIFFHYYCNFYNKTYLAFFTSRVFVSLMGISVAISLTILFIIYPQAILEPLEFIRLQTRLRNIFTEDKPLMESVIAWADIIKRLPVIALSLFFLPTAIVSILIYNKSKNDKFFLYSINLISILFIVFLVVTNNRHLFAPTYLQPIYPFCILALLGITIYIKNIKYSVLKALSITACASFFLLVLCSNIYTVIPDNINRLMYKESIAYQTNMYTKNNITSTDKVAHDHYVSFPNNMRNLGCHYWQGCGNSDTLNEYKPNYVMFLQNHCTIKVFSNLDKENKKARVGSCIVILRGSPNKILYSKAGVLKKIDAADISEEHTNTYNKLIAFKFSAKNRYTAEQLTSLLELNVTATDFDKFISYLGGIPAYQELKVLKRYVEDHNFSLVKTIRARGGKFHVLVYKK